MHLVVLDSVGIGAAPDANDFVNAGVPDGASDTLGHISKSVGLNVPNMAKLGLGNIPRETPLKTVPTESNPTGYATKLQEVSLGKDTMTGHWEIMGLNITEPFDTFWNGFPEEILTKIEEFSGRKVIRCLLYTSVKMMLSVLIRLIQLQDVSSLLLRRNLKM